jgi:hypothetical protein
MTNYEDPENWQSLFQEFKEEKTEAGMLSFIKKIYPDWVIAYTSEYCDDYPHLIYNWKKISDMNNVSQKSIVIVEKVFFDTKDKVRHNLIMSISEHLTRNGYVIRRKEEYCGCIACGRAIPVFEVYNLMKSKGIPVPSVWMQKCQSC